MIRGWLHACTMQNIGVGVIGITERDLTAVSRNTRRCAAPTAYLRVTEIKCFQNKCGNARKCVADILIQQIDLPICGIASAPNAGR